MVAVAPSATKKVARKEIMSKMSIHSQLKLPSRIGPNIIRNSLATHKSAKTKCCKTTINYMEAIQKVGK